jgi:hypothetical protein
LLLGDRGFARRQVGLCLSDATSSVVLRLSSLQRALRYLLLMNADLLSAGLNAILRVKQRRLSLSLLITNLGIVQSRDDLADADTVAFAVANLENATGSLGCYGGVVALDSTAYEDNVRRGLTGKEDAPNCECRDGDRNDHAQHDDARFIAALPGQVGRGRLATIASRENVHNTTVE